MLSGVEVALSDVEDKVLVELHKEQGEWDERPFQELFQRYYPPIWRICCNYMGNSQDADDLTQDVFMRVYRYLPKFEQRSSFKTWIYRIAINSCHNEVRRRSRRPQLSDTELETVAQFLPSGTSTEEMWEAYSEKRLLETALNYLRPEESQILRMKDLEERPYAEITEALTISLSAAKMRAKRAREALKVAYMQATVDEYAAQSAGRN